MFLLYPVAKPCALLLDYLVHGPDGKDGTQEEFNRHELSALVHLQYEQRQDKPLGRKSTNKLQTSNDRKPTVQQTVRMASRWTAMKHEMLEAVNDRFDENLDNDEEAPQLASELTAPMEKQEIDVVVGALQLKTRVAMDVFTPRSRIYSIPDDLILDRKGVVGIYAKGYSRVPVYCNEEGHDKETNQSRVLGFLMTRQLMLIDWDHEREVSTLPLVRPLCVSPRRNLVDLLKLLRSGGSLMAFVCARPDLGNKALQAEQPLPVEAGFIGIVTLEDILESILQTKIYDERDVKERDRAVAILTKWAAEKLQRFARRNAAKRRGSQASRRATSPVSENTPLLASR
jgi:metal transporter CNNM